MSPLSKGEFQIQRLSHVGPVTAIAFTPDDTRLLYGSGPTVTVHSIADRKEENRVQLFKRNRIHGIKVQALPEEILVLLWGVTSFACLSLPRLCEVKSNEKDFELIVPDWTLDSRLLNRTTVGVVTAHNSLLIYSLETKAWMHRFDCQEQSLLYSAQIYVSSKRDILIAAGTVFNEIQLWRPSLDTPTTAPIAIEKRLVGHEGCVFSLRFNNSGTLLASCSDDRTIRVWNVDQGEFLAIGYAHVARVWDVQFLPSTFEDGEKSYLLSNSEDTTALLWEFSKSDTRLKVQERYEGHSGKHIWSQAINRDGTMAATGGNDGGVNLWDIAGWRKRTATSSSEIFWSTMSPRIMVDGHERLDSIKGCKCIRDKLLLTTNSGRFYTYSLSDGKLELLFQDDQIKGYSTISSFDGLDGLVCLGDSSGEARLFNLETSSKNFRWKVSGSLIRVFRTTVCESTDCLYILAQGVHPQTSISVISKKSGVFSLVSQSPVKLPTGFEIASFLADPEHHVFFLGSRQGALACYELGSARLVGVWRRVHDQNGLGSIKPQNSALKPLNVSEILTTGRDWAYKILQITLPESLSFEGELSPDTVDGVLTGVSMECVHRSVLNGGWLEGSVMVQSNLLLWGYSASKFEFWNETTGELIFEHRSGGAHRVWDFYVPAVQQESTVEEIARNSWLVYTSKSELFFRRAGEQAFQKSIRTGNHGREIRSVALRPIGLDDDEMLLASGSEDTYINFTEVLGDTLKCVHRHKQYKTGIMALAFSSDGNTLFSSAGQYEVSFSSLRIGHKDILSVELGGFSKSAALNGDVGNSDDSVADLRIMDLDVCDCELEQEKAYYVATGLSDSTIKLYVFFPTRREYRLVAMGKYTTCCILVCRFVPEHNLLIISATDGYVALLKVPPYDPTLSLKDWSYVARTCVHQSSVKALDLIHISESVVHLVTGGDDNAIHLTEVTISDEVSFKLLASAIDAHSSTITGILVLTNTRFLSVGIDQNIRMWEYQGTRLTCIYSAYTFVPDVCGIVALKQRNLETRRFLVFGTGMELISLEDLAN